MVGKRRGRQEATNHCSAMKGKESPENVNEGEGENKVDNFIGDKGNPIQMTDLS
jgi:hypothetical protein